MHRIGDTQETPEKLAYWFWPGGGGDTTLQAVPSHHSASGAKPPCAEPTARQAVGDGQATDTRSLDAGCWNPSTRQ